MRFRSGPGEPSRLLGLGEPMLARDARRPRVDVEPVAAGTASGSPALEAAADAGPLMTARPSLRSGARSGQPLSVVIDLEPLYFSDPKTEEAI